MIRFCLADKTPRQDAVYTIDWSKHIASNDVLIGAQPTALDVLEGSIAVDQGTNNAAENKSSFRVSGGIAGEVASFRVGVTTQGGDDIDAICSIGIREK